MPAIRVSNLKKTFSTKQKAPGLAGSFRAILRPQTKTIEAIRDISFDMSAGERLGLIGPNGAGKSTTIKMLTGILFPTAGQASVLGYTPWEQRRELAYHLGTVFGQRPQLWYHLPAIDTFHLFGKIYELEETYVHRRIAFLSETFDIKDLLETPVRKLSLGQRMRCEVAASLIHSPKLILLDEPSIGLDVVAKQRSRDTIRRMNETENVGVLLTSHDAGDLEALCKRVIIINHGQIVFQDSVSNLKRHYLTTKEVSVRYAQQVPSDFSMKGLDLIKVGTYGIKLRYDSKDTTVDSVLAKLAEKGDLVDITISDPSLEEVITAIYQETGEMG